jgi:hypothetical protein
LLVSAGWLAACGGDQKTGPGAGASSTPAPRPGEQIFVERATDTGLDFVHFNGMSGEYYMAEVTGSGGALFDYDNDGDLDVYFVQGTMIGPGRTLEDALFPPTHPLPLTDRLYRNDLELADNGEPVLRFTDVTDESGIAAHGYGMGVAAGDYDNDGWIDLYVTNLGPNQMLRNRGDGTFEDTTEATGTDDPSWSVPTTFFDYDGDGWLDLYVGNYIDVDLVNRTICRDFIGALDYCGPGAYDPIPDRLFRNRGDGTFEDVSKEVGFREAFGAALGVVAADFNRDGHVDLYVANDALPNNLWMNQGDGTFIDDALLAGCSVNAEGKAEASMGVDAADFDGDGDLDLFMTHLTGETNTFFLNDGLGNFNDETLATGLGPASRSFTSFGTSAFDYDNDGWLDILIVSGAVKKIEALAREGDPFPVHQPNQLFHNTGGARFEEVTRLGGPSFELSEVSRGAMFGDIDNDGDRDVVIANNNGPARLLVNQVGNRSGWIGLRLVAGHPPRDMVGAMVAIDRPDRDPLWRRARTDGSFCSANDPRILAGLGSASEIERVRVYWTDGSAEEWTGLDAGRYHELRRGSGRPIAGAE